MALTDTDLEQIKGVVTDVVTDVVTGVVIEATSHLATKDELKSLATKDELQEVRFEAASFRDELRYEIRSIKNMFEEDYMAESDRVTRVSRRLDRTREQLKQHIANKAVHR